MDDQTLPQPIQSEREWEEAGWAEDPEPLTAVPRLGAMISIRLDPDAAHAVRQAAVAAGITQVEFVRRAALQAASQAPAREAVTAGTGQRPATD